MAAIFTTSKTSPPTFIIPASAAKLSNPHNHTMQPIHMVDVQRQYQNLKADIDRRVLACMESGAYIHGPDVKNFEASLSFYLDNVQVVSCANGTDALQIALMALGYETGDEVIVPSFTFVASI